MKNSVGDMQIAQEEVPRLSRNLLHNNPPAWKTQPHPVPGGTGRTSSKQKLTMVGRGDAGGNRETQLVVEEKVEEDIQACVCVWAFVYGCVCVSSYCFCVFNSLSSTLIFFIFFLLLAPCLFCIFQGS